MTTGRINQGASFDVARKKLVARPEDRARARDVPKAAGSESRSATLTRVSRENIFSLSRSIRLSLVVFDKSRVCFNRAGRTGDRLAPQREASHGERSYGTYHTSCAYAVLARRSAHASPKRSMFSSFLLLVFAIARPDARSTVRT